MDLQNAYYLAALVLMLMGIVLLVGCIIFLTYLFLFFRSMKSQLSESVNTLIAASRKKSALFGVIAYLLGSILRKTKEKQSQETE